MKVINTKAGLGFLEKLQSVYGRVQKLIRPLDPALTEEAIIDIVSFPPPTFTWTQTGTLGGGTTDQQYACSNYLEVWSLTWDGVTRYYESIGDAHNALDNVFWEYKI